MSEQHLKWPPKLAKILCDANWFFIDLQICFLFHVTISYTVAKRTNTGIHPAGTRLTFNVESTLIFNHTSTKPEFNQISTIYQFLVDLQRWFNVESTLMFNYNFQEKKVDLQRWFNVESTLRINQNFQEKLGWSSTLIQRWINVEDQLKLSRKTRLISNVDSTLKINQNF